MMTGQDAAHRAWHWLRRVNSLLNTFLLVGGIVGAAVWWWHSQETSDATAANRLNRAVERIEGVTHDIGNVESTARDALSLAHENRQGLEELRGRVIRGEERQTRRDQEVISRLERIEGLLLEGRRQ